jgi:hypothetical protein
MILTVPCQQKFWPWKLLIRVWDNPDFQPNKNGRILEAKVGACHTPKNCATYSWVCLVGDLDCFPNGKSTMTGESMKWIFGYFLGTPFFANPRIFFHLAESQLKKSTIASGTYSHWWRVEDMWLANLQSHLSVEVHHWLIRPSNYICTHTYIYTIDIHYKFNVYLVVFNLQLFHNR